MNLWIVTNKIQHAGFANLTVVCVFMMNTRIKVKRESERDKLGTPWTGDINGDSRFSLPHNLLSSVAGSRDSVGSRVP